MTVQYHQMESLPNKTTQSRLTDIEQLKGLVIVLVVWGHVYEPVFPVWALDLRQAIYSFHMPLFMFLSGFIFFHVESRPGRSGLATFTARRAKRLLIPFAVMSVIVLLGKFLAASVVRVDKPVTDILLSASTIFYNTEKSPVFFVWYLVVLFYYSVVTKYLMVNGKFNIAIFIPISLVLYCIHIVTLATDTAPDILYANRFLMYYVFFVVGCAACAHRELWLAFVDRFWLFGIPVFLLIGFLFFSSEWRYLVVGLCSCVVFHGLVRTRFLAESRVLNLLAVNAFSIYLLNLPFIGVAKGVMTKVGIPPQDALIYIGVATVSGVLGPMAVRYAIRQFAFLKPVAAAMD